MSAERIELVRKSFDLYNEGGPAASTDYLTRLDVLHPEYRVLVQDGLPNAGEWRGVAGYEEMARSWLEAWSEFKIYPREVVEVDEDHYLVDAEQSAVARGSGIEINGAFFYTVEFRDGKVACTGLFAERSEAERSLLGGS